MRHRRRIEADFVGVYKRSKYLAEQAVLDLARTESLPVVVVNPAAPVGSARHQANSDRQDDPGCSRRPDAGLYRYRPEHRAC